MEIEDKELALTDELLTKMNIFAEYMLVRCGRCGHKFGINFLNNKIAKRDLVCRTCAAEDKFAKILI